MKSLHQVCFENFKQRCLVDYFGEDFIVEDWHRDYILENLNTHDGKLLAKKLEEKLPVKSYEIQDRGDMYIYFRQKLTDKLKNDLKNIADFYGYYITLDRWTDKGFEYILCPTYSKNYSKFIYDNCCGVCYHICETDDVDSILSKGLRCKNGRADKYREFPKRIYVIAIPVKEIHNIKEIIKGVVSELGIEYLDLKDYSILRINKTCQGYNHGSGPDFYQDDAMKNPYTFFTYTNIPASQIKDLGPLDKFLNKP